MTFQVNATGTSVAAKRAWVWVSVVVIGAGCTAQPIGRAEKPARGSSPAELTVKTVSDVESATSTASLTPGARASKETSPWRPAVSGDERRDPVKIVHIVFDVLRARVPAGVLSDSERVWSQLDTAAIPADSAAMLQPNGLRAARGKLSAWPAIKQIIEKEEHVEIAQNGMPLRNGAPLVIEPESQPKEQTLFLIRRDGKPAGASFPRSTNVLRVDYGIPVTNPNAVMIEVFPEIRLHGVPVRPRLTLNGWVDEQLELPHRSLRELMVRIEIGPDEFLVIGPSSAAHQAYLPGTLLLCEQIDGKAWESVYFITPKVVSSAGSMGP
jgi:hypothetical protein